ncbi:MAG: FHA domain-containing protein, partial [Deltaproteobacteria bacterium]|nr:FHA domain-containing protein [Nannocystaceae bacterium]
MRRQLRAIEGPLAGAVFVVDGRTRLGRAGDSDIQILHDGVSRQHAQVIEDNAGHAVLMDLASNNGTFIGERRVVRHRLAPGDEIRIMRARFLYEEVEDELEHPGSSAVFAVKVNSAETHRRTVDHWQLDLPAPRATDLRERESSSSMVAEPGAERHRVVACFGDGSTYEGDILGDILEYRALRLRSLRGDALREDEVRRYGVLQGALHQPPDDEPDAAQRRFFRFRCQFPARLRHGAHFGDRTARVTVVDIGAGGAAVSAPAG